VLESEGKEVPDLEDRSVEGMARAPAALDFRRYRELREGVDHGHEVEVKQRRSSNQLAVCEVPAATDPHQHRVRRRASKVVDKAVVVLRNPPCGVVGLRRHEALDGNSVRHGPLGVGIEVQGLVEDHRPNDRLATASSSAIQPLLHSSQKALTVAERKGCRRNRRRFRSLAPHCSCRFQRRRQARTDSILTSVRSIKPQKSNVSFPSVLGGPMSGSVTRRGWYSPTLKAMSFASFVDGFGPILRSR
jgi:hypothetical protein